MLYSAEQMQHPLLHVDYLGAALGQRIQKLLQQPVRLFRLARAQRLNQAAL
ncbi:hypothetical protein D3C73_1666760 [compost metagenome]